MKACAHAMRFIDGCLCSKRASFFQLVRMKLEFCHSCLVYSTINKVIVGNDARALAMSLDGDMPDKIR